MAICIFLVLATEREQRAELPQAQLKCNPIVLVESKEGKYIFVLQQRNLNISKRNAI